MGLRGLMPCPGIRGLDGRIYCIPFGSAVKGVMVIWPLLGDMAVGHYSKVFS